MKPPPTVPLKIAISGIEGSFTEDAALRYCSGERGAIELLYSVTPEDTFVAVVSGQAKRGIVPLFNSVGGIVTEAVDAMSRHHFRRVSIIQEHIEQNLLALPGTKPTDIRQIVSHPQALAQCRMYLAKNWLKTTRRDYANTALAARDLAEGKLPRTSAIIASSRAAQMFGLEVLAPAIQDSRFNFTSFLVFSRRVASSGVDHELALLSREQHTAT
jgi:prephenate dehydratase